MMGGEEMMVLQIGYGHVIYTGGAKGTDELAESWGRHFGMQVEVLVPLHHSRAQHITPSTVEVLVLAKPHIHLAVQKLGKRFPVIIIRFNCYNAITRLLKKPTPSLPLEH